MKRRSLIEDPGGSTIVEFAVIAPVFLLFLIGIFQVGQLFFANADLENAVARGARTASVYPLPEDAVIIRAVREKAARLDQERLVGPTVRHYVNSQDQTITEIEAEYEQPFNLIFVSLPGVVLKERQVVFTQPRAF